jgi:Winged helix DNA-binding domain
MRAVPPQLAELARWRLASQHLSAKPFTTPEDVVGHMLAMQAQDYGQALWAIGSRTKGATVASIEKAVTAGRIIRTWPMRGTIHWVLPDDARWLVRLCGSRVVNSHGLRLKQLELTQSDIGRAQELLEPELSAGRPVTRARAMQVLEDGGLSTAGQRGYTLLWHLAHLEVICFGPMEGKQQTFVLLDEVAPQASSRELAGDEALTELATRYAGARGPVTAQDLAKWAGLKITDARRGLAAAASAKSLSSKEIEGNEYWFAPPFPRSRGAVLDLLLAGFDEYLIGYGDRSAMLAAEHANAVVPGANGVFKPMIVMDGQITGTWARTVKAKGVTITRTPFVPDGADTADALRPQAERYAAFLGVNLLAL